MTTEPDPTAGSPLPTAALAEGLPDDVPAADALEQATPAVPPGEEDLRASGGPGLPVEADEADVAEQAAVVDDGGEDDRR